jgi:hypothetical protein
MSIPALESTRNWAQRSWNMSCPLNPSHDKILSVHNPTPMLTINLKDREFVILRSSLTIFLVIRMRK